MQLETVTRLLKSGQLARARKCAEQIVKGDPRNTQAIYMLATCHLSEKRPGLASGIYEAIIETEPDFETAYNNAVVAYKQDGRLDKAVDLCEHAIEKFGQKWAEDHAANKDTTLGSNILANLAAILLELGDPASAEDVLNLCLKYAPKHIDARWNRSLALLQQKKWVEGFPFYEFGFPAHERQKRPYFNDYPHWNGDDPKGKKLLVWGEQGLGDEILFAQCIPDLIDTGADILFDCHPRLETIFRRSFPDIRVEGQRKNKDPGIWDREGIDYQIAVGSLPRFFRHTDEDFRQEPYLVPKQKWVEYWKSKLGGKVRIGLSWQGGPHKNARSRRSVSLDALSPIILPYKDNPNITFVSLQYGEAATEETHAFNVVNGTDIRHYGGAIEDFTQTADLTSACDLVISVVTTIIHLGGALGVPVWCMVPQGATWKFTDDPYNIWHPTVKQYHQEKHYIWQPMIEQIAGDLQGFINERL